MFSMAQEYPKSYGSCIGCHGLKGERNAQSPSSQPNRLSKYEIIKALHAYQNHTRNKYGKGHMMQPFVKHLSHLQIKEIAHYLSKK